MAANDKLFIGLDVGGTSVKMGLFDEQGELVGRGSVPTPPLIDSDGYAAVTGGISNVLAAASAQVENVYGIGLAIPCPVPADGVIRMQANIQINAPGLEAALKRHCPNATVKFENDANAAAMGELWAGAARGRTSCVFVTIGTGVGGGIVVDGHVVSGIAGAGGEIGHLCMNPDEERTCGCGGKGHLEQYASATGIVTSYLDECEKHGSQPVELDGPSDSRSVFAAAAFCLSGFCLPRLRLRRRAGRAAASLSCGCCPSGVCLPPVRCPCGFGSPGACPCGLRLPGLCPA